MFHKNLAEKIQATRTKRDHEVNEGLQLVREGAMRQGRSAGSRTLPELAGIAARRGSAFFAEAAVLVLVFGILDFFLQKGHIEPAWVAGALVISVALLCASVATEFSARRWLGAQP